MIGKAASYSLFGAAITKVRTKAMMDGWIMITRRARKPYPREEKRGLVWSSGRRTGLDSVDDARALDTPEWF